MTLSLAGWDNPEIDTIVLLNDWLSHVLTECWLLVFDNVDDLAAHTDQAGSDSSKKSTNVARTICFPTTGVYGEVLLTSRDRRVGEKLATTIGEGGSRAG